MTTHIHEFILDGKFVFGFLTTRRDAINPPAGMDMCDSKLHESPFFPRFWRVYGWGGEDSRRLDGYDQQKSQATLLLLFSRFLIVFLLPPLGG